MDDSSLAMASLAAEEEEDLVLKAKTDLQAAQAELAEFEAELLSSAEMRKEKQDDEDREEREKKEAASLEALKKKVELATDALRSAEVDADDGEDDDDSDDEEEDPRIGKLRSYASSHTVQETVALLVEKIGDSDSFKPCVIGDALNFSAPSVMAFILVETIFDIEKGSLSEQMKSGGSEYLKELAGDLASQQIAIMCALERCLVDWEIVDSDLHRCWNELYGSEIVTSESTPEPSQPTFSFKR